MRIQIKLYNIWAVCFLLSLSFEVAKGQESSVLFGKVSSVQDSSIMLKEVAVLQRKVYKDGEKTIYKVVQDKFSTSRNVKNVLLKLPSVSMKAGDIRVNGNDDVLIQIDGRGELKDQAKQLALLSSYSADQIDKVEIITSPSAKYDSNVNSVINIITKKTKGVSNVSVKFGQPVYSDDKNFGSDFLSAGINSNLNFKIKDIRTTLVLNTGYNREIETAYSAANAFNILKYDNSTKTISNNFVIRGDLTFDYDLNPKSSLAFNINLYTNPKGKYEMLNGYHFLDPITSQLDSATSFKSNLDKAVSELEVTGKYKYQLNDKKKSFLYFNVIYANNFSKDNRKFEKLDLPIPEISENNIFNTQTDILNTSLIFADVVKSTALSTEFGIKSNFLTNNSSQLSSNDIEVFKYQETLLSGFVNAKYKFGNYLLVAGLRNEWIDLGADYFQSSLAKTYADSYMKLYPNILLQKTLKNELTISLSYNKRLRRLRSIFLNPIRLVSSYYGSSSGNFTNKPMYMQRLEGSLSYKNTGGSVYFQEISNQSVFLPTTDPFASEGANLGKFNLFGVSNYFLITEKMNRYSSTINTDVAFVYAAGDYNGYFKKNWLTFNISSSSDFNLSKASQIQLELSYIMGSYSAYSKYRDLFVSSITYRYLTLKQRLAINVELTDPLGIQKDRSESYYPNRYSTSAITTNSRAVSLQLLYKFNLSQKFRNQTYKIKNDGEIRQ